MRARSHTYENDNEANWGDQMLRSAVRLLQIRFLLMSRAQNHRDGRVESKRGCFSVTSAAAINTSTCNGELLVRKAMAR